MTETAAAGESKFRDVVLWVLQLVGAGVFALQGASKLVGEYEVVDSFATLGYGQWVRYAVAIIEIAGAFLLLFPMSAEVGAWLLMLLMVGAIFANVMFLHASPGLPIVLLVLMILIAIGRHRHRRHHQHHAVHHHGIPHTHDAAHHSQGHEAAHHPTHGLDR